MKHTPEKCVTCGQTKTYAISLDKGTAMIVLAIYNAITKKKENNVHLMNEMCLTDQTGFFNTSHMVKSGFMTPRMVGNATRARYHGLIAFGKEDGEYMLTKKGALFLRDHPVPHVAIIDKLTGTKLKYLDELGGTVTFSKLMRSEPFWHLDFLETMYPEGAPEMEPML